MMLQGALPEIYVWVWWDHSLLPRHDRPLVYWLGCYTTTVHEDTEHYNGHHKIPHACIIIISSHSWAIIVQLGTQCPIASCCKKIGTNHPKTSYATCLQCLSPNPGRQKTILVHSLHVHYEHTTRRRQAASIRRMNGSRDNTTHGCTKKTRVGESIVYNKTSWVSLCGTKTRRVH